DGRIYVIGGNVSGSSNPVTTVQAYTPGTNTWTTVAPMSVARHELGAALGSDGRIYAVGGRDAASTPLTTVEAYTIGTNTWTTVAAMPTARRGLMAAP